MDHLSQDLLERIRLAIGARSVREGELVQRLWAGYGEIRRVHLDGAPWPSVIVKHVRPKAPAPGDPRSARAHSRKLRSYAVEASWYERFAIRCTAGCRVARLLWSEQAFGQSLFVLEDLDAAGFNVRQETVDGNAMRVCLEWLAQFHATFAGDPGEGLWWTGTYWHLATRPDELAASREPVLLAAAPALAERLQRARFRSLVHGDAKLENFCFTPELGAVAAVDFQYVGPGVGVQDVVYFFSSCLDEAGCDAYAATLLDAYFASLRRALATQQPHLDAAALEAEWRALYPTAWADFCRFLSGWAPEHYAPGSYTRRMVRTAVEPSS